MKKKTFAYSKKVNKNIVLVNAEISCGCSSWCVAAPKILSGVLKKHFFLMERFVYIHRYRFQGNAID